MKFESAFNIGDKVWVWDFECNCAFPVTIGQIKITHTDSKGRGAGEFFDNFKPQRKYTEEYMMEETGIGSGNVYTLNRNVFKTKEECEKAKESQP